TTMAPIVEVARYEPPARPVVGRGRGRVVTAANSGTQPKTVHHQVKPGETLSKIAARYGASVQRILQANGLRHANLVRIGSTLVIPRA
ncbi:MAG: LysM peptidoglycan-binding domain-containing protein, partial [Deltaproteobacteria bacterium]|nr:LysM peptidoglycan-binding domain-containing protein [Deltaproteobacteria bacterium]